MYGTPYQKHSGPSRDAATFVAPVVKSLEQRVFEVIAKAGNFGLTDEEVYILLASYDRDRVTKESTIRARRVRLCELGKVTPKMSNEGFPGTESLLPVTRKTQSGRNAQVWIAA